MSVRYGNDSVQKMYICMGTFTEKDILLSNHKNYNEYSILDISSIFVRYAQSVHFRIFQFAITA